MKKYLKSIIILGCSSGVIFVSFWYWIMADAIWMSYFRTCQDPVTQSLKGVNLQGLKDLPVSGSNRLLLDDLQKKLRHVEGPIYVVDLTGGGQTYYQGKYPIDFLGLDSKHPELLQYKLRRWFVMGNAPYDPNLFVDEKTVVESYGYTYVDLYQKRRETPAGDMVDRLIQLVKNLPKGAHLHLHCRGGKGRTTSIMVLIDIIINGREVALEDIVKRHYLLGGINLFDTKVWKNGTYTKDQLNRRKEFIENFYDYVNDPEGYDHMSWVDWCDDNDIDEFAKLN
jgi:hypothetical protein